MAKENQRIALTKRMLGEGLLRLLEAKPLDKISVTELCMESGINRATFYRHYETPRDVLLAMQLDLVNDILGFFENAQPESVTIEYLESLCTHLYNKSELIKIFIRNNSDEDIFRLLSSIFQRFIQQRQRIRGFENIDDASLKLISSYMAGGGYFMLRQWLMDDIRKTPAEIAELALRFISREYL